MERLGETAEFGSAIAGLIQLSGWTLHPSVPAFGGGRLFIATREWCGGTFECKRVGATFADVATDLLEDCLRLLGAGERLPDTQLQLPGTA